MSDLEKLLRKFPTLEAPSGLWERVRAGNRPRRPLLREAVMLMAAAGLLAWLGYALTWKPTVSPGASQGRDDWVDEEPAVQDLPSEERTVLDSLIEDLVTGQPSRREAAARLLEGRLDMAIPLLRQATRSENGELRRAAVPLVTQWEASQKASPLRPLLAGARKEAVPKDEWKPIAKRALAGSVPDVQEIRKIGWPASPILADQGVTGSGTEKARGRRLLREILLPRLHKIRTVRLLRRKEGEGYGASVYSFRYSTGDVEACKNYVDVVYNNCGLLHVALYGGTQCFVADAGTVRLDQVSELPKEGWREANCFLPREGHVYALEIREAGESFTYRIRVKILGEDDIELEWSAMGDTRTPRPINPLKGKAGDFGRCGGAHAEY